MLFCGGLVSGVISCDFRFCVGWCNIALWGSGASAFGGMIAMRRFFWVASGLLCLLSGGLCDFVELWCLGLGFCGWLLYYLSGLVGRFLCATGGQGCVLVYSGVLFWVECG